jgi:hypothetical protein
MTLFMHFDWRNLFRFSLPNQIFDALLHRIQIEAIPRLPLCEIFFNGPPSNVVRQCSTASSADSSHICNMNDGSDVLLDDDDDSASNTISGLNSSSSESSCEGLLQLVNSLIEGAALAHLAIEEQIAAIHAEEDECLAENVGGSKPGRSPNLARNYQRAYDILYEQYFRVEPRCTFTEYQFERRFRMPRAVFNKIKEKIFGRGSFVQRHDALGKPGIHPLVRLTACLRRLAYGTSDDAQDEKFEIGEETLRKSLKEFCALMVEQFGAEYLNKKPSAHDLARLSFQNRQRGFPGMFASWDCKHFVWKNCPVRLAGQYRGGKEKVSTLVLEAICDKDLFIYHCFFGEPGSLNDINILQKSSIVAALLTQELPLTVPRYDINGTKRDYMYFLVDGIYPSWSIFVKPIHDPENDKESLFTKKQEAARKDIERAFGVLVQRFHILKHPFLKMKWEDIVEMLNCCIIMHNMIAEYRAPLQDPDWFLDVADDAEVDDEDDDRHFVSVFGTENHLSVNDINAAAPADLAHFVQRRLDSFQDKFENATLHNELLWDLQDFIWEKFH